MIGLPERGHGGTGMQRQLKRERENVTELKRDQSLGSAFRKHLHLGAS